MSARKGFLQYRARLVRKLRSLQPATQTALHLFPHAHAAKWLQVALKVTARREKSGDGQWIS
jgi:hypothetical protein